MQAVGEVGSWGGSEKYQLRVGRERIVRFDAECVVFNPLSWEIHLLNAAAAAICEYLGEAPRTLKEIETLLGELLVESERCLAAEHARRIIVDLTSLGLVSVQ